MRLSCNSFHQPFSELQSPQQQSKKLTSKHPLKAKLQNNFIPVLHPLIATNDTKIMYVNRAKLRPTITNPAG
jgi:hypothetical protein